MERRELQNRRREPIPYPRLKSYVEVVKDNHLKDGKISKELMSGEVDTEVKKDLVTIQTSKTNTSWLDNIWVGRLKNKAIFEKVDEEVQGVFGMEMKSTYWGDDLILLHDLDDDKAQELIRRERESGGTPLISIQRWSPDLQPSHRLTWLYIWGVPLKAWDVEHFATLVSGCGEFIELDEETKERKRMDVARVLVRTTEKPNIARSLLAIVDRMSHQLEMREEMGFH